MVKNLMKGLSATVMVLAVSLYLLIALSSLTIYASPASYYLMYYGDGGNSLNKALTLGCYPVRDFKSFEIMLLWCPDTQAKALKDSGVLITPNFNVSLGSVKYRVYGPLQKISSSDYRLNTEFWSWAVSRVSADLMWNYLNVKGRNVVIAVLDTGIDPTHSLLVGKLRTLNSTDPYYPGGWIEFNRLGKPVCSKPHDTHWHGTWVSSIAVGGDVNKYLFGIAPEAKLMVGLVLPGGSGTAAQVLAGLEWVLNPYDCSGRPLNVEPPDVVSMSFGASNNYSNIFLPAIKKLIEAGVVLVAAIGNEGPYTSSNPGNVWGVVGVGATNFDDKVASFSSYEEVEWPSPPTNWPFKGVYPSKYVKPDLVAPGVDVPGAYPGDLIVIASGTSAATPIVAATAGIIANILKSKGLSGSKLVEQVYEVLTSTAKKLVDVPGAGHGRLNAYLATSKALGRTVNLLKLTLSVTTVRYEDLITLTAEGLPIGANISVFFSGIHVYSGPYRTSGINFRTPSTHLSGNTVVALTSDGSFYGETLAYVMPYMKIPREVSLKDFITVMLTGLGVGDLIIMYFNNNLLTLDSSNLRGFYNASLAIPYVKTGTYEIVVKDLTNPTITLRGHISLTEVVREAPPTVVVRVEPYYVLGDISFFDVTVEPAQAGLNVLQLYPYEPVIQILNITSVSNEVSRVFFKVSKVPPDGVALLKVKSCLNNVCSENYVLIKIVEKDPINTLTIKQQQLSTWVSSLNLNLTTLSKRLNNLTNEVGSSLNDLILKLNRLNNTLAGLSKDLSSVRTLFKTMDEELRSNLTTLSFKISSVENELSRVKASIPVNAVLISSASLILACTSLAISFYTLKRRK